MQTPAFIVAKMRRRIALPVEKPKPKPSRFRLIFLQAILVVAALAAADGVFMQWKICKRIDLETLKAQYWVSGVYDGLKRRVIG